MTRMGLDAAGIVAKVLSILGKDVVKAAGSVA